MKKAPREVRGAFDVGAAPRVGGGGRRGVAYCEIAMVARRLRLF